MVWANLCAMCVPTATQKFFVCVSFDVAVCVAPKLLFMCVSIEFQFNFRGFLCTSPVFKFIQQMFPENNTSQSVPL